jgi:hypothetical protein
MGRGWCLAIWVVVLGRSAQICCSAKDTVDMLGRKFKAKLPLNYLKPPLEGRNFTSLLV